MMIKYCIPFYYLFKSRLKTTYEKMSWVVIYPVPVCFICYSAGNILEFQQFSVIFLLSIVAFYTTYEIGYMVNDTVTINKEHNPTIRNSENEIKLLSVNWQKIAWIRVAFSILLIGVIYYFDMVYSSGLNILAFVSLITLEIGFFYLHNTIRSKWNVVTFFMLSVGKYVSPLVLFVSTNNFCTSVLISFFMFPVLRTIEHSTKIKYGIRPLIEFVGVIDGFRVKYYAIMFTILLALSFLYRSHLKSDSPMLVALTVFGYFLVYRIASLYMVKKNIYRRY